MTEPPADIPAAAPDETAPECFDLSKRSLRGFFGSDYEHTMQTSQAIAIMAVGSFIPIMLVMVLLQGLLGEGVWRLMPLIGVAVVTAGSAGFWLTLWQSPKPIRTVSGKLLAGKAKRRLIGLSIANAFFGTLLGIYWSDLREALMGWTVPYPW